MLHGLPQSRSLRTTPSRQQRVMRLLPASVVVSPTSTTVQNVGASSFNLDWNFPLLTPQECAALLRSSAHSGQTVVLDVRNQDEFEAGHIANAVHVRADECESGGPALDAFLRDQGLDAGAIVVHCMFSQKRGPMSAKALQKKLKQLRAFRNQVYLLSGGIAEFMELFQKDTDLVYLPDPENGWKPVPH